MTVSLLVTTYNWPQALQYCLESVLRQSRLPDEILIADDGSQTPTREVVSRFEQLSPVPIRHIWHEDRGFRVAAIRNKAIAASSCDYIVQIDGDLILEPHFIEDHIRFAKEGCYLSGSRGIVSESLTRRILGGEPVELSARTAGVGCRMNARRIPILSHLYRLLVRNRPPRSCNMSLWRKDLLAVNGYDEAFEGWGYEDTELGARLKNSGVIQRVMKFRAIVFHLHHTQASRANSARNEMYYKESLGARRTRCDRGVDAYLAAGETLLHPDARLPIPKQPEAGRSNPNQIP